jgi:protein-S-isoprenylcysteine O-methyltransferase Ste14
MNVPLRTLIFTVFVPGGLTVAVPYFLITGGVASVYPRGLGLRLLGIALIALGASFYLACAWDFTYVGRGTPAIWDPPKSFVSRGLYRYVRNPMYLGIVMVLAGEAVFFGSSLLAILTIVVALSFHLFVLFYEEPHLRKTFGNSYEVYCSRVRRWVPRIPSRTS